MSQSLQWPANTLLGCIQRLSAWLACKSVYSVDTRSSLSPLLWFISSPCHGGCQRNHSHAHASGSCRKTTSIQKPQKWVDREAVDTVYGPSACLLMPLRACGKNADQRAITRSSGVGTPEAVVLASRQMPGVRCERQLIRWATVVLTLLAALRGSADTHTQTHKHTETHKDSNTHAHTRMSACRCKNLFFLLSFTHTHCWITVDMVTTSLMSCQLQQPPSASSGRWCRRKCRIYTNHQHYITWHARKHSLLSVRL